MPLELWAMVREEALEAANLSTRSFVNNPFGDFLFPNGPGPQMFQNNIERIKNALDDPDSHVLQIYDTDARRMAAYAIWVYTKPKTDDQWEEQLQARYKRFSEARQDRIIPFLQQESAAKHKVMGKGRWWELDSLSTLPEYQRKGLGSRLMKWGTDRFEEMKVGSVIVATEQGVPLYLKHGYQEVKEWDVDLEQWGGRKRYRNAILTRYARE